jgi:hypothetical protein
MLRLGNITQTSMAVARIVGLNKDEFQAILRKGEPVQEVFLSDNR